MPTHTVGQGESLNSIALQHGLRWKDLWDHPNNEALRQQRGDPNVLLTGDEIYYPEMTRRTESCAVDQRHTFKMTGVPFKIDVTLRNTNQQPMAGVQWYLEVDGEATPNQTTGEDGRVQYTIQPTVSDLVLVAGGRRMPLKMRDLDPANTAGGIQQRLANLGW